MTSARQDRTTLFAGVAKIDITPTWPLPLAGFASRRGFSASVASPIHLRAAFLETRIGSKISRAVIVSADLLWWPPEHVDAYRAEIARRFDLPAHSVILTATHNHSGPQPSSRFAPSLGLCDARFVARLEVALLDVVATAARSLEPVTVRRGRAVHRLGMNRRATIDGHIRLAPNPDGQDDPELTVISLHRASGTPAGVVIHYACHPVISTANLISGEFSGVAMDAIERQTGATAIFLQGCSGDINPGDAGRTAFANGGETGITRAGTALANAALDVLHGNSQRLDPVPIKRRPASTGCHSHGCPPLPRSRRQSRSRESMANGARRCWPTLRGCNRRRR